MKNITTRIAIANNGILLISTVSFFYPWGANSHNSSSTMKVSAALPDDDAVFTASLEVKNVSHSRLPAVLKNL
jgi:hypothetical protein